MQTSNVNPTRMELRKIRNKLKVANKGHTLLKDKTSGLIKIFYQIIKETRLLRSSVDTEIKDIFVNYQQVKTSFSGAEMRFLQTLANNHTTLNFDNVIHLGVTCPNIQIETQSEEKNTYSPLSSSFHFDYTANRFKELLPKILELASKEKCAYILAGEIEKCKRRTKALEDVIIPTYEEQIKKIELKLSSNELENTSRLKTIKNKKMLKQ